MVRKFSVSIEEFYRPLPYALPGVEEYMRELIDCSADRPISGFHGRAAPEPVKPISRRLRKQH